ncbi:MAG: LLM class F420-dependent oxidoreductase [Chloroflexota bacterium]
MVNLGRVGIWTGQLDSQPASAVREIVAEVESLGYGAIWYPESRGRESIAQASILLSATKRIIVAPGIANIYARDAVASVAAQYTLNEAFGGRFVLGLGVSHQPSVEAIRGHTYAPPYTTMRAYLDAMDQASYMAAPPAETPTTMLAALGPRMLELAATRTLGAHPYFVPVEHTQRARQIMGPNALLAPEQAVILETNRERAYAIARAHTVTYTASVNYGNNLKRLGFTDDDLVNGGSDRLIEAIIAWGTIEQVAARVKAHLDAGADHVCVQVLNSAAPRPAVGATPVRGIPPATPPLEQWRQLAPALLSL